jgi:glycosyltransferase involved in cell wall biosynthesis
VGRLTPRKDPLTILEATARLVRGGHDVALDLVGAGLTGSDEGYKDEVHARIASLGLEDRVVLHGAVPYIEIPAAYARSTVVVNASLTGSLDKVSLESMASRRPVVSCNDSAPALFAELGAEGEQLYFEPGDVETLTQRLEHQLNKSAAERLELGDELRGIVARDHEVDVLMARLVREMGGNQ